MFSNYIKIAIRSIAKNKFYAAINILGLAIGLTVYVFGGILADYEYNHDTMYENYERTYTVGSLLSPTANVGVKELDQTYSAMTPFIKADMGESVTVARTIRRGYLASIGDKHFHESFKFADKELLQIFDFDYIFGDSSALNDPKGLVITEDHAMKLFGRLDIMGETVMLDHEHELHVTAVIREIPKNSHFNSSIIGEGTHLFSSLVVLNRIAEWDLAGNWNNLSLGNNVYVMTEVPMPLNELNSKLNAIYDANVDPELKETFITALKARPLKETNSAIWDMIGMPVIESIQILGMLVLIIAIVNYTNLATAQSMGRAREVGMRKTLGAGRKQLMAQFLTESLTIAVIAMFIALVALEVLVPQFNAATDKVLSFDFLAILPWLATTTIIVGLVSGAYPSYLITNTNPIDALRDTHTKGKKGSFFRSLMIGTQFMLSIFMLALVMIVFFQNQKVKESSLIFPKDEVITLKKMGKEAIHAREDTLRNELLKIADVERVTFASQVPFEQSNNQSSFSRIKGDEDAKIGANNLYIDPDFLKTFDIPLLAGRDFSRDISGDKRASEEVRNANVIINRMLCEKLGYANVNEAIGETFWGMPRDDGKSPFQYNIIGVVESQNILGLHNDIKPWVFTDSYSSHYYGAIRIKKGASADVVSQIEDVWKQVIPDYPIDQGFLDSLFNDVYKIYKTMNMVLAGFAGTALLLALIGLFGLAAFMARSRTKEIGIRKVLGANRPQLVKMLLWQFSKPVMWAIIFALPLSYFVAGKYLQFFAERIEMEVPIIIAAGILAVGLAWAVIAMHALKVARENPIKALRYE